MPLVQFTFMSDTLILVDALSFADEVPTNEDKITQADCLY